MRFKKFLLTILAGIFMLLPLTGHKNTLAATCSYTFPQTVSPGQNIPVFVDGVNGTQYQVEITIIIGPSIPVTASGSITAGSSTTINIAAPQNPADYQLLVKDVTGGTPLQVCNPLTGARLSVTPTSAPPAGSAPRLPDSPAQGFSEQTLVSDLLGKILPYILGIGGFLTIIFIIISGIQFATSSGNPEAAAAARNRLIFAIIGFVIIILAFAITQIINTIFLGSNAV